MSEYTRDYTVRFYQDDQYEIVDGHGEQVYRGTIVEVNAWLDMVDRGYEL